MKRHILPILAAALLASLASAAITQAHITAHTYPETAVITEIDESTETITVTCANGNRFSFRSAPEDWFPGDLVSMTMHDNGTETVEDDRILQIRYSGTPEMFQ